MALAEQDVLSIPLYLSFNGLEGEGDWLEEEEEEEECEDLPTNLFQIIRACSLAEYERQL
jgi:hypothetical protein